MPTQSAEEILIKPSSVIWQPQQLRELQERGDDSVRKKGLKFSAKEPPSDRRAVGEIERWGTGGPVNSHVEVAEVDGGADEARGGVVAGALAREAQPPPRRQRPLHGTAPPPARSPSPDDDGTAAKQQSKGNQNSENSKMRRWAEAGGRRPSCVRTWTGRERKTGGRGCARGGRRGAARCPPPPRRRHRRRRRRRAGAASPGPSLCLLPSSPAARGSGERRGADGFL